MPPLDDEILWRAGSFSLGAVLGGHAACPPDVRGLVFVSWRPPDLPPARENQAVARPAPPAAGGPTRRASDRAAERPGAAAEEATMRAAWETGLSALTPVASGRLGACELGFATATGATGECQGLFTRLCGDHPAGDWRVGMADLEAVGVMQAARALELWVLDAADSGSWLVDVTGLASDLR